MKALFVGCNVLSGSVKVSGYGCRQAGEADCNAPGDWPPNGRPERTVISIKNPAACPTGY
jgi:hypothetical protein